MYSFSKKALAFIFKVTLKVKEEIKEIVAMTEELVDIGLLSLYCKNNRSEL